MAECEKIMQLCDESLDRTLTHEEQQTLNHHLAECPACAAYLADLKFLSGALSNPPDLPDGLHEKIMSGIRADVSTTIVQTHRPMRPVRWVPMVTTLAAAAACVVLALSGAVGDLMNTFSFRVGSGGGMDSSGSSAANGASPAPASTEGMMDRAAAPAVADDADSGGTGGLDGTGGLYAGDTGSADAGDTGAGGVDAGGAGSADTGGIGAGADPADAAAKDSGDTDAPRSFQMQTIAAPEGRAAVPQTKTAAAPEEGLLPEYSEVGTDSSGGSEDAHARADDPHPQVGAFISDVMKSEVFAACYLVQGGSSLPEIGQEQQRDGNFAYYAVDNNLAQLEILLDSLEKAGCTVNLYEESGVLFNPTAERVIFVVRLS